MSKRELITATMNSGKLVCCESTCEDQHEWMRALEDRIETKLDESTGWTRGEIAPNAMTLPFPLFLRSCKLEPKCRIDILVK